MSRLYVETSALLRTLLEGDAVLARTLAEAPLVTSALTFVEAARAISRARREGRLDARQHQQAARWLAAFEQSCDIVALDAETLRIAREDLPAEPVRTLDALHLAALRVLDVQLGDLSVATCDDRVRRNAVALGFSVLPRS